MATITLPDPTFRRLQAMAAARGLTLDAYLEQVSSNVDRPNSDSARQLAALESFTAGMTEWTARNLPAGHIVDDSRDKIYEDRGG